MSFEAGLIIFVAVEILLLCVLIITLDGKIWAKIDRVVAFMIMEREDLIKKINSILERIENIEKRINQ